MIRFSAISSTTRVGRALRWPLSLLPRDLVLPVMQGPLRGARWITGSAVHGCWLGTYELEKQAAMLNEIGLGGGGRWSRSR